MANLLDNSNIIEHEIYDEMKNSYIDYAMSVIVGRALPDVRDGLKPVHRRILYGMHSLGITPDKPHRYTGESSTACTPSASHRTNHIRNRRVSSEK